MQRPAALAQHHRAETLGVDRRDVVALDEPVQDALEGPAREERRVLQNASGSPASSEP